ncbi:LOW QUALITY PROTEIN: nucleoredoxin-like protein 1 [Heterocephalus glaber]|uniref:LOW QUALITY PROTEIN: nucleoredoxin-like protein 1 n=1 Tax=Heterocephalus glaber TaxID=10181 RepID=A0AAX6QGT3_HETGA|nr:LOW QUALITY PROTEIN: nucleoredoxin-like protein 1 [Heterocephalus glaber]
MGCQYFAQYLFFSFFETRSRYVAQAGLELVAILLPQPPACWGHHARALQCVSVTHGQHPQASLGPRSRSGPGLVVLSWLRGGRAMASLFSGRVLIRNSSEQDLLETEAEHGRRLENRLVLLFFGAGCCARCRAFAPALRDFFVRLTDEFHVVRAAQLALVYVSQDATAEQQALFLRDMPERCLFLPFEDDLRRDLGRRFCVQHLPAVVVLKPDGDVLTRDAADEIQRLGRACFANWQEAAEVLDRSFLPPEDWTSPRLDEPPPRSLTEPLRLCKYRVDRAPRSGRGLRGGPGEEGGVEALF